MQSSLFTLSILLALLTISFSMVITKITKDPSYETNIDDRKNDVDCTPFGVRVQYGQYLID